MEMNLTGAPVVSSSLAADIIDDLFSELVPKTVRIEIPNRPNYVLICTARVTETQMRHWQKRALSPDWKPGQPEGLSIDQVTLAANVIADNCIGIERDGVPLTDEAGNPVTLASAILRGPATRGKSNAELAKVMFGNPIHLADASSQIMDAAGEPAPFGSTSTD